MNENILNEESNTLTGNLARIRNAADNIRSITGTENDEIEVVAQAVSDLNDDNIAKDQEIAELEEEIERITPKGTIDITQNGSINVAEYESAIVDVMPTEKVAYFCDYDGTILYSYGVDEIAALEELPANPSHSGLTAQGWNWTLPQIKECVADGGHIDIGQTYITDDNSTRIHITLSNVDLLSPTLTLALEGTANINWGDGSTSTLTGTGLTVDKKVSVSHTYASTGEYTISILSGSMYKTLLDDSDANGRGDLLSPIDYMCSITEINCSNNFILGHHAFYQIYSLKKVTLPKGGQPVGDWGLGLSGIQAVVLPIDYISLEAGAIRSLEKAKIISLPYGLTSIGPSGSSDYNSGLSFARCVKRLALPSVTVLPMMSLTQLHNLEYLYAPRVTTMNDTIFNAFKLKEIILPELQYQGSRIPTCEGSYSATKVEMPKLQTIYSYMFRNNYDLQEVDIPLATTIQAEAFNGCKSLKNISFPLVTSIGDSAFKDTSLQEIDLSNVSTLGNLPFSGTRIRKLDLRNVSSLGSACYECSYLTEVLLPSNLTSIPGSMFRGCSSLSEDTLQNILSMPSLISLGDYAFYGTNLTDLVVPENIKTLGSYTFGYIKPLTSAKLLGVTTLGRALNSDTALLTIEAPRLTRLAAYTVNGNTALRTFYCNSLTYVESNASNNKSGIIWDFSEAISVPTLQNKNAFSSYSPILVVPEHLYNSWKTSSVWSTLTQTWFRKDTDYYGYSKKNIQFSIVDKNTGANIDYITSITIYDNNKDREVYFSQGNYAADRWMIIDHTYNITVKAPGYETTSTTVTINNAVDTINIELEASE